MIFQHAGIGLSDAVDRIPSLEDQADDLGAVLDAEGVASATIAGIMAGAMPVTIFAARSPERVEGLVLWNPFAQGHGNADDGAVAGFSEAEARASRQAYDHAFANWGAGRVIATFDPNIAVGNRRVLSMLERSSASPGTAAAVYEITSVGDIRAVLPLVRAPTRVLYRGGGLLPEGAARLVAELIDGATFHRLPPSEPGMSPGEATLPLLDHVAEALSGRRQAVSDSRRLATILFTDVASSTKLVGELGDKAWRELLARHEHDIRAAVTTEGGRVVKLLGDGSMSVFDGPVAAIRAATSIRDHAARLEINVRAGVHTGECNLRPDGDISGLAVHVASRVASAAGPGEIWVSRTVRDLAGGAGLRLRSEGSRELKGIDEPWELFAVVGEADSPPEEATEPETRAGDRLALAAARRAPRLLQRVNRLHEYWRRRRAG